MDVLPPSEAWKLFPSLTIIVLIMIVMGLGLWYIWKEYKKWTREQNEVRAAESDKQDLARAAERERQRQWEEQQDKVRDERWQAFLREERAAHALDSQQDRATLARVAETVDRLVAAVDRLTTNHQDLAGKFSEMHGSLKDHITEDSARFDVLLDAREKAIVSEKLRPTAKGKAR